jgi:hypothetical protein
MRRQLSAIPFDTSLPMRRCTVWNRQRVTRGVDLCRLSDERMRDARRVANNIGVEPENQFSELQGYPVGTFACTRTRTRQKGTGFWGVLRVRVRVSTLGEIIFMDGWVFLYIQFLLIVCSILCLYSHVNKGKNEP